MKNIVYIVAIKQSNALYVQQDIMSLFQIISFVIPVRIIVKLVMEQQESVNNAVIVFMYQRIWDRVFLVKIIVKTVLIKLVFVYYARISIIYLLIRKHAILAQMIVLIVIMLQELANNVHKDLL